VRTRLITALAASLLPMVALAGDGGHHASLGDVLPVWSILPFAGLLLSIALMPMFLAHFWHNNRNQLLVALAWSAPIFLYLAYLIATDAHHLALDAEHRLVHAMEEYVSFIALLGSLYVIPGGIFLRGDLRAKPSVNTAFLAVGALLANVIGTTGASMLLIRPMLRTNAERKRTWHIPLFFIFLVSNVGGALTPIGDPPLFLGYLRGVPFFWTLTHLWPVWVPVVLALLLMFYVLDTTQYRKETANDIHFDITAVEPLGFEGSWNFLLLAGVVGAVLLLSPPSADAATGAFDPRNYYLREIAMAGLTAVSMFITHRSVRERNNFEWGPILEVAALFIGIFVAMIPATVLLQTHGAAFGLTQPWQYFWSTGTLSAFLDNAPTYVTFAALACGNDVACVSAEQLAPLTTGPSMPILVAISLGAVFMGAGSYIGNGPNFMVRAIAEGSGFKMPSFFGYCGYALVFLGPVFLIATLVGLS